MPVLNDKECNELNPLNLIIVAFYKRYIRSEEHALSAFWAKMVMGFCLTIHLFTLWEIVVAIFGMYSLRRSIVEHYLIFLILGVWVGMTYFVHKLTVPNQVLRDIHLHEEEYLQGQKLGWFHLAFSGGLTILFLLLTKPHLKI
ncbi:hypothetical protein [Pontibacter actiniarum]|uniref:Uncharacterized protein n=1 Tax=Pontibacter actiniarum TaxID=323450 RepID=A0A1X9YP96_9BACT|nr:hypothetical protein [Pontibacter actiniarum]ARS34664.1 hypothetical protein CA264_03935 [Pontibacter actiniarum]